MLIAANKESSVVFARLAIALGENAGENFFIFYREIQTVKRAN